MTKPSLKFEQKLWQKGYKRVAGIDEAGRGPLAGPVVAASVILPMDVSILGINDSKKLTQKRREDLYGWILGYAVVGVKVINHETIDEINILNATKKAMVGAVEDMTAQPDYLLIDGTIALLTKIDQEYIIKGDEKSMSIAAASIIATPILSFTLDKGLNISNFARIVAGKSRVILFILTSGVFPTVCVISVKIPRNTPKQYHMHGI